MNTIAESIARHAACQPDKTAIVCGPDRCTYAALHARIENRMAELLSCFALLQQDYSPGTIVPLRAEPSIGFLVTYFALHRLGLVAAPLERDLPEEAFQHVSNALTAHRCPPGTADVLYTTGTTGHSKGVMVSHTAIIADAENLIAGQGFTKDLNFVVNGPLNHIGSLSKVYPVMLLGATLIIVDGLKDLSTFFSAFDSTAVSETPADRRRFATFLVPASIRILLQMAPGGIAALADRLDFIETGAAALAQADMETLCRLLPDTRLYNTYASTETGIICTHNFNRPTPPSSPLTSALTPGCLGRPLPHSGVHIVGSSTSAGEPPGVGLIACTGDTLMTGYVGEPERTAKVLRGGVLYTSDLGIIDAEGRLHLQGREDDVINVGGFKVAPTEVEDAAMSHPSVADCLCTAVDHKITGKALKLIVVTAEGATLDKRTLAQHLRKSLEPFKVPMLYEQAESIKRTFNGKPDRKAYLGNN